MQGCGLGRCCGHRRQMAALTSVALLLQQRFEPVVLQRELDASGRSRILPLKHWRGLWTNSTRRLVLKANAEPVAAESGLEMRVPPQDCTYGLKNIQWLSRELQRLLTIQGNAEDGLVLTRGMWSWELSEPLHYRLRGQMQFFNLTKRFEVFVPEVQARILLLGRTDVDHITSTVKILPRHPGGKPAQRDDGYWQAYIIRAGESTAMEVVIDVRTNSRKPLKELQAIRLEIAYVSYGPHGRTLQSQYVVLPVEYPDSPSERLSWKRADKGTVLPVRTHLLCHLDDPLEVLQTYVLPHAKAGDVVAIGETPLAIMQGRFRHPEGVRPGIVARLACLLFHPTSSLATACGMQTLVDMSGRLRVIFAVFIAVLARLVGVRGVFYRLAGAQARLIDDVSGTLPPYDQFITLGPVNVKATVDALKEKTGLHVAVVDVNDLKRVQILAASDGLNKSALEAALLNNPAGNADEQTPLVLVRGVS